MGWQTKRLVEAMRDAYDFYFDEMSQVKMPSWSAGRVALLGEAGFGPSPMSGQGTSLALIGAYLLAYHISKSPDIGRALALWSVVFVPTWSRTSDWPPTAWPRFCPHRGSPSSRATRRCGCFPCWRGLGEASAVGSKGVSGGNAAAGAVSVRYRPGRTP